MHPIIQAYIETDEKLLSILELHADKAQFLEAVFFEMMRYLTNEKKLSAKMIIDIDKAIIKGHVDSNLYTLFVSSAIIEFYNLKEYEKAKSLYSIAVSTINEMVDPIIQAVWFQAKAKFLLIENDLSAVIQLVNKTFSEIDNKPSRYLNLILIAPSSLAIMGLLNEIKELDSILTSPAISKTHIFSVTELKLVNHIITGQTAEGYVLLENYRQNFIRKNSFNDFALNELNILNSDYNHENYPQESYKILVNIYSDLLASKVISASLNYQKLQSIKWDNFLAWNFVEYIPIHIELCLGSIGKARLLLKEKIEAGKANYLDDLFLGRLLLLEKNSEAADNAFIRLINNINRYAAMGRLVFELQFAKEMKLSDILLLTQGWKINKKLVLSRNIEESNNDYPKAIKGIDSLVGASNLITNVKEMIKSYGLIKAPILISGETGTGKELVARAIHDEGKFSNEPFLAINCGALTESLLQSELYGYVAGAFTGAQKERKGIFESAGNGTVFLDEFGGISSQLQVSLLRVLESNEIRMIGGVTTRIVKCRIIIATNDDLFQLVQKKKFREDLYFRLSRFEIRLPTLKQRIEDLPELIGLFLNMNNKPFEKRKSISEELLRALTEYHWPGNIRELKNEIERLYILHSEKKYFEKKDFDFTHLREWSLYGKNSLGNEFNAANMTRLSPEEIHGPVKEDFLKIINERRSPFEIRQSLLKAVFIEHKKLTRHQVMGLTKTCPTTATKDLQVLCKSGFIVRRSPTNSSRTYYFELV